jgi:hypothetical protein
MDIIQHILESLANIWGYWAFFEARSWEEVGRWLPTSYLYKTGLLKAMGRGSEQVYASILLSQSHCHVEKLLRNAPLWAIFGSFVRLIWVPSVLMGS